MSIISTATSAVTTIDGTAQYAKQKLDRVQQQLHFLGVDANLRHRVVEFYRYVLAASHTLDDQRFLRDLPEQVRTESS